MNIDLNHAELSNLLGALEMAIDDRHEQAKCAMNAEVRSSCTAAATALSELKDKLQRRMNENDDICDTVSTGQRSGTQVFRKADAKTDGGSGIKIDEDPRRHKKPKYIIPEHKACYRDRHGSIYECVAHLCGYDVILERVPDHYRFVAHGIQQHKDGTIEWDYSTGGHWNE